MAMFPGEGDDAVLEYIPGEVATADIDKPWTMFFDGSSYGTVGGAGVVFEAPQGEMLSYSLKLDFPCTPYRTEAQRLMNRTVSTLDHTGRGGNKHADALETLKSKVKLNREEEGTITIKRNELLNTWKEYLSFEEEDDWRRVYIDDLTRMDEGRVIPTQALKQFVVIQGTLYYRAAGGSLARCVNKREAEKLLQELHAETCGQIGVVHLYGKLQRKGVYWPSMSSQASALQDSCADCQAPPQPAEVCTIEEIYWRQPYFDFSQHGRLPSDRQAALKVQRKAAHFFIHEGVLYRRSYGNAALRCLSNKEAAEATNKTLIRILSRTVHDHHREWNEHLPLALWAYRISKRSSTGASPYSLVYGEDAILPAEIAVPSARIAMASHTTPDEIICFAHLDTLEERRTRAERFAKAYRKRATNYYNQSVKEKTFKVDGLVLKISPHVQRNASAGKIATNWKAPS
ncbi:uncharacterized protein LOC113360504 [Papaver somniferum]|uniref:uncharacterized protein LOC113360504 n=1 Tax=Papaver somniferum TaxID=3469 RepID=UPI000E6F5A27|nr:uncharacterized protein LOC113360504 [Papaver somniferum]